MRGLNSSHSPTLASDWKVVRPAAQSCPERGDSVDLPIREVARDAIVFDAVRVVMAHNHPSGDPAPSRADIARHPPARACALDALGVTLYAEHVILSEHGFTSLRAEGVL